MSESARQRREVHYRGQVQGVGFRFTACQIADRFSVTGYVRNLADGRVQLVAEGEKAELDAFLQAIATRMAGHIMDVQQDIRPATDEFQDFTVRH